MTPNPVLWLQAVHQAEALKDHRISATSSDPVLLRIESEEAIIAMHEPRGDGCAICTPDRPSTQLYPCRTLMLLAAGWRDHPGYRPEWAEATAWWAVD